MINSIPNLQDFKINDLIRRGATAETTFEYNCHLRRLYPWSGVVDTKRPITEFGAVLATIDPNMSGDAHSHDEEETFIVVSGQADLLVQGQSESLEAGDVAYVPRNWQHQLKCRGDNQLVFLDIYWDLGGSKKTVK